MFLVLFLVPSFSTHRTGRYPSDGSKRTSGHANGTITGTKEVLQRPHGAARDMKLGFTQHLNLRVQALPLEMQQHSFQNVALGRRKTVYS